MGWISEIDGSQGKFKENHSLMKLKWKPYKRNNIIKMLSKAVHFCCNWSFNGCSNFPVYSHKRITFRLFFNAEVANMLEQWNNKSIRNAVQKTALMYSNERVSFPQFWKPLQVAMMPSGTKVLPALMAGKLLFWENLLRIHP